MINIIEKAVMINYNKDITVNGMLSNDSANRAGDNVRRNEDKGRSNNALSNDTDYRKYTMLHLLSLEVIEAIFHTFFHGRPSTLRA